MATTSLWKTIHSSYVHSLMNTMYSNYSELVKHKITYYCNNNKHIANSYNYVNIAMCNINQLIKQLKIISKSKSNKNSATGNSNIFLIIISIITILIILQKQSLNLQSSKSTSSLSTCTYWTNHTGSNMSSLLCSPSFQPLSSAELRTPCCGTFTLFQIATEQNMLT